jgi:hypothetical protein
MIARAAFNNRILPALIALVKDGAQQRKCSVASELERVLRAAYLATPASATATAPASAPLAAPTPQLIGQRVVILADNLNTSIVGTVIASAPQLGQPFSTAPSKAEPRLPYFDEPGQEVWP